jgi:GntR family transcriptional regulator
MQIQIDFRSGAPIYIQIMEQIQHMVANGELKQGDQLPTVRQLATDLRVNFNTVARAYRLLDESRLISTQQGRGTYIWEPPSEETTSQLRKESLKALAQHFVQEAAHMGFSPPAILRAVSDQLKAQPSSNPNGCSETSEAGSAEG